MTECPIFKTFAAAEKIWTEVENLVEEFSSAMTTVSSNTVTFGQSRWRDGDNAEEVDVQASSYWVKGETKIRSKGRGPARTRSLTLYFDLTRGVINGSQVWPHARQGLLLLGFYPQSDHEWGEYCAPTAEGTLKCHEVWDDCRKHAHADNRLLNCSKHDVSDRDWSYRAWLFATPLRDIANSDAVVNYLAKPVHLLLTGSDPSAALASTKAVVWNIGEP